MNALSQKLGFRAGEFYRHTAGLAAVPVAPRNAEKQPDIQWKRELRKIVGYSDEFGTVKTYATTEEAQARAAEAQDAAIAKLENEGWRLVVAPKTIDADNHDWRRVCRVKDPNGTLWALVAYAPLINLYFDPWIY